MLVLSAMSGGVDSSVATAALLEAGHEVVGVTLKLWGGDSDSGCCSVSDVDDARRVADELGVEHLVFNFGADFDEHVVEPYVADHAAGRTPNPCVECNRHLKFDRLLRRARALGFDAVATGHHARVLPVGPDGERRVVRGVDAAKDQSYVIHMLTADQLGQVLLPIGGLTKAEVRARARALGLRTAAKPDSQDVCFVSHRGGGRRRFLGDRIPLRPGRVVDADGAEVGTVPAVELVTVGQRRGLGAAGDGTPHFAVAVDTRGATVTVGPPERLLVEGETVPVPTWVDGAARRQALAGRGVVGQLSAHGRPVAVEAVTEVTAGAATVGELRVRWTEPQRRVAPGQSLVLYADGAVLGGGPVG